LTRLTFKDKLEWSLKADQAFQHLKIAFKTAPILIHPNFSKPLLFENDLSDYALGARVVQVSDVRGSLRTSDFVKVILCGKWPSATLTTQLSACPICPLSVL
jgi:hypothetical protein